MRQFEGDMLRDGNFSGSDQVAGAFFGNSIRHLRTQSFQFKEMWATVPEREVPRHAHDSPHFILVMSGVYITEARNQNGFCSAGTVIFNPTGTTHRDRFSSKTGRFLSIAADEKATQILSDVSDSTVIGGPGFENPASAIVMNLLLKEWRRYLPCPTILEGLGMELIGLGSGVGRRRSRNIPGWLLEIREMTEDSFDGHFSIADLAAGAGVHPVYLARAYRQYFGCSPGEYRRYCRLFRVRDLLTETDSPLAQIALQCGFNDQSQMTRSFSDSFGTSPARYRRLRRHSSGGSD